MITAMVRFQLGDDATTDKAAAIFRGTAPRYLGMSALIQKPRPYAWKTLRPRWLGLEVSHSANSLSNSEALRSEPFLLE